MHIFPRVISNMQGVFFFSSRPYVARVDLFMRITDYVISRAKKKKKKKIPVRLARVSKLSDSIEIKSLIEYEYYEGYI